MKLFQAFLAKYDAQISRLQNRAILLNWNYETNITDENSKAYQAARLKVNKFEARAFDLVGKFDQTYKYLTADTQRQLSKVGRRSLPSKDNLELLGLMDRMGEIYGSTKVCLPDGGCEGLTPGLENIMARSTDYGLRLHVWKEWRNKVGRRNRPHFIRYVELKRKITSFNKYSDLGDMWRQRYGTDTFADDIEEIYKTMEPLYLELHAYIRRKLCNHYGAEHVDLKGPLPAHLAGDMWGMFWDSLLGIALPFPDKPDVVPSAETMKRLNFDTIKMFKTGDNFYANLGMYRVPQTFWNYSILRKPEDGRKMNCHPTAWDFSEGKDYRIRMCASDFKFKDLQIIHHELGHIQYHQQYKNQPYVYRNSANDGFGEAIGELMALVSSTPSYLSQLGLLDNYTQDDTQQNLNFLMSQALITVSALPFYLAYDQWSWNIFSGDIPMENWNAEFWRLKRKIVGVVPAIKRNNNLNLDGATIFHTIHNFDMIRYFTRTILQFQFFETLCKTSGHTGPLHRCNFSGSKAA